MNSLSTAQRVSSSNLSDPVNYNRHLFSYLHASTIVNNNLIEVGCGDGYGIDILIDKCDQYVGVDKKKSLLSCKTLKCFDYFRMVLPCLKNIPSNIFNYAISFQVIEHIKDDITFIKEIYRVLRPGGTLLLTTPNRLRSVSRNPWHEREYIAPELRDLCAPFFANTSLHGVFANERAEEYFTMNKTKLAALSRLDLFNLQQRLPNSLLRFPYDVMNALFKRKLNQETINLNITYKDFYISSHDNNCLDLFLTATK